MMIMLAQWMEKGQNPAAGDKELSQEQLQISTAIHVAQLSLLNSDLDYSR
jgi:hypothetical protein